MPICKKQRKIRPPLKPREGPYKPINAYTTKFSIQQIATLILGFTVAILHSIFLVKAITKIDHPILYILLALNYVLVAGIIFTYAKITIFDPVDSYILNPGLAQADHHLMKNVVFCPLCRSYVHQKSYHCKRCNRCTQDFDHHCVFLNNCIGSLNYQLFMRLLLLYILFLLNNIAQSIWVYVVADKNSDVETASITKWMSIVIIIICVLQVIATSALLGFHCYISCCLDLTTIAFYQSDTHSGKSVSELGMGRRNSGREEIQRENSGIKNKKYMEYNPGSSSALEGGNNYI